MFFVDKVIAQTATPNLTGTTINIAPPTNLRITELGPLISRTVSILIFVAALATFIFLLWGGIQWITSGGDKAGVEAAQHRIQAAILGLFIVFAAWALMNIIGQFFGIDVFNFTIPGI